MPCATVMSNLQCPECQNVMSIPRSKGKRRENNHVKHMWCFKCKEVTGHIEQRFEFDLMKNTDHEIASLV